MPLFNNFPHTNFHQMNLDWVLKKVKLIDDINDTVQELLGRYNQMFNKVTELSTDFDTFASDVQSQIDQWTAQGQITIQTALANMQYQMQQAFTAQDARISALNTRVGNVEQSLITANYMESPFTGETVPVQQVIYELASLHTTDALTSAEYDAADLTAAAYDALQITAYAYDWNGKQYIN